MRVTNELAPPFSSFLCFIKMAEEHDSKIMELSVELKGGSF
jgi:hypothetical protein